jgi:phosphonate transport system permease protein
VIWALLFVNIIGLDSLSAVLALGIPFGAITAKVFSEILDEVPRMPFTALCNAGATRLQALAYGLLPLALPNLISYSFYRFECAIRSAAVLGVIGAGGLGYQLLLSLQSLRYNQMWTLLYVLMVLSGLTDLWSSQLRHWLGTPSRLDIKKIQVEIIDQSSSEPVRSPDRRLRPTISQARRITILLIMSLTAVLMSFWYVQPGWHKLFEPRALKLSNELLSALFPPNFSAELLSELFPLALQTIAMSVLAIAIAAGFGMVLAYPAARRSLTNLHGLPYALRICITVIMRLILLACRAVPAPIWALLLLFVFFPGLLPGALAIAMHNLGILGRLLAETVENIDQRPVSALKAQGASTAQAFAYGVLPLTLPQGLAYSLYRWEICVRETVIVGLVGAGGLGRLLSEQLSSFDFRSVITTLIVFIILTHGIDIVSGKARSAIR